MNQRIQIVSPATLKSSAGAQPLPLQLTPEAIDDFRRCPHRFARTYVERLPVPKPLPSVTVVVDRLVHQVIAEFFRAGDWRAQDPGGIEALLLANTSFLGRSQRRADAAIARGNQELLRNFHRRPYPVGEIQELGVDRRLAWRHFRRGVLAIAQADRICRHPDGTLEVIDYRTGGMVPARKLRTDTTALFLRSLVADTFGEAGHPVIRVTVLPVKAMRPVTVEFDRATFDAGWAGIYDTANVIRQGFQAVIAGEPVASAFEPTPGSHCASCALRQVCEARRQPASVA